MSSCLIQNFLLSFNFQVGETEEAGPGSEDKENTKPSKFGSLFESLTCGQCGAGFANLVEYIAHKKVCIPDEDFSVGGKQEPKTTPTEKTETKCDKPDGAEEEAKETNIARDTDSETAAKTRKSIDPDSENHSINQKMTSELRLGDVPSVCPLLVVPQPPAAAGPPSSPAGGVSCASCGDTFPSMVKYETHRGTCQK